MQNKIEEYVPVNQTRSGRNVSDLNCSTEVVEESRKMLLTSLASVLMHCLQSHVSGNSPKRCDQYAAKSHMNGANLKFCSQLASKRAKISEYGHERANLATLWQTNCWNR